MKKVLLRFYSANNLGDDLFIKIVTERYKNQFSLISYVDAPFLKPIKNIRVYKNRVVAAFSHRLSKLFKVSNLWLSLLAKKNDLFLYVGGSIFMEQDNLSYWKKEKKFYDNLSIDYYILGLNFGPYATHEFKILTTDIFKRARDVCFRDKASYTLFNDLGTTRASTDIVFSMDTSKYTINKEKIAIFSLINCEDRFNQKIADKYDQEIRVMTKKLVNDGYKVIYMSFCQYESDETVNQRVLDGLDKTTASNVELFRYYGNLEEALALIAKCEIVIATRFHAVILGLLFSKKVLPLAYSKKTSNILHDLDFKGEIVDINKIEKFDGSAVDFTALRVTDVTDQVTRANLQFQELDKVLVKKK